ncbi:MAG: hypothetical protein HY736_08810 [Verrucomicrobia bacterium]|nr:hypothetical protein [Verrucomicrobiota bacterium]
MSVPKPALIAAAALVVLGGGFFAWKKFSPPPPPPPPPVAAKQKAATPAAAPAPAAGQPAPLTPSDTLNTLAKVPVNAINKAQGAVATRQASGQSGVDAVLAGEDPAGKRAANPPAAGPAGAATAGTGASRPTIAVTSVGAGLSATTEVDAAPDASPAFRSFVMNAKIAGVFWGSPGTPARAFINGKLARPGETVDSGLGVVFEGVDTEKKQLIFKDKSGASVLRKY